MMKHQSDELVAEVINSDTGEIIDDEPGINVSTDSAIVIKDRSEIAVPLVNEAQLSILIGRTPRSVIKTRPGKGRKTFSYVPHGYITSTLNRAFGFDWDWRVVPIDGQRLFLFLEGNDDPNIKRPASVVVHGELTVRIHYDPDDLSKFQEKRVTSVGEKEHVKGMTWGSLIKSAESDAFKKAASRMGIALDLYWQDADEDYLDTAEAKETLGVVDQMRESGMSDGDIAKTLKQNGKLFPEIGKLLGIESMLEVVQMCRVDEDD